MCLNRRERQSEGSSAREKPGRLLPHDDVDAYDSLERLGSVYEGLFRLDKLILLLRAREMFIKSCLTDGEQFNIKIIAKGMHDIKGLATQIANEHNIDEDSLKDMLAGLKLPQQGKFEDAVKTITYHLINKLSAIQHDLEDSLREYDSFHNTTINEYENMRRRFFDLTLSRDKGADGIDFKVSKRDFMFIVNSKNGKMVDIIFNLLDTDGKGVIDWGAFEMNSGRILCDAKGFL
ncbi:cobalamin biosynthesis protein CobN [Babesia caballi]|uniref:Cobalamin biosynthesis protein CobN n=1 Tax=Babesia caballi TaxID=5871 RepID=A0AAV4LQ13_BABCB|nr:cobalamin biosynthesis protein CobN [Babesia caballi]